MILQVHAAAEPARVHLELAGDAIARSAWLEDDEVLGQPRLVLVEAATLIARPARPLVARKRWP